MSVPHEVSASPNWELGYKIFATTKRHHNRHGCLVCGLYPRTLVHGVDGSRAILLGRPMSMQVGTPGFNYFATSSKAWWYRLRFRVRHEQLVICEIRAIPIGTKPSNHDVLLASHIFISDSDWLEAIKNR